MISVVIPLYNQAEFLTAAVESILNQTYSPGEILIVDDGSTDGSLNLANQMARRDERIKVFSQSHSGPAQARNLAIRESKGDYIALLDADDLMKPDRLKKQLQPFLDDQSLGIVYTAVELINEEGGKIGELHGKNYGDAEFFLYMLFRNLIPAPGMILARREIMRSGYHQDFYHAEDYEFMVRQAASGCRFHYIDECLSSYRRHGKNLSNQTVSHRDAELRVVQNYRQDQINSFFQRAQLPIFEEKMLRGKILYNQENWQGALDYFLDLNNDLAIFYVGNCFYKLNEQDKSIEAYQQSLALNPHNACCYNNLGVSLALQKKFNDAEMCWKKALMVKPEYQDPAHNLLVLQEKDKVETAFLSNLKWTFKELRQNLIIYR